MDWIRANKVPAAIIGVSLAGVIGLGVVLYSSYSAYDEKMQQFNSLNVTLQGLKNGPLAPTKENVDAKNRLVTDYATKVDQLGRVLVRLQKAPTPTTDVEFQSKLKSKIAAIRQYAGNRLPAVFNLGFDRYISELPPSNQVATELSTYLDGMDEMVRLLMDSGIESLETLERTELDLEKGASAAPKAQPKAQPKGKAGPKGPPPPPAPAKVSERWPVRFVFRTDQAALQTLMSRLASPSDTQAIPYFPIVKLVRIENQRKEGPPRNVAGTAAVNPGDPTVEVAAAEAVPATPTAAPQGANADAIAAVQPADKDAETIFGDEKLVVFLEVDFVRFLESAAAASR
jgi:hypothetical protein